MTQVVAYVLLKAPPLGLVVGFGFRYGTHTGVNATL